MGKGSIQRVFHGICDHIYTELTFINPLKPNHKKLSAFVVCRNVFEASFTNSVDPDQTALMSSLIWGPRCLPLLTNKRDIFCGHFKG